MNYNPTVDYRSDRTARSREPVDEPRSWITEVATRGALWICVTVWALAVWYPVLVWVGIAELTPADVWSSLVALPWSDVAGDLWAAVSAVIGEWAAALGL